MPKIFGIPIVGPINSIHWWLDYWYIVRHQAITLISSPSTATYKKGDSSKPVLVILPGVYEKWQVMKPLMDTLHRQHYRMLVIDDLGYNISAIEASSAILDSFITRNVNEEFIIVAHSKGGLIGNYYMQEFAPKRCLGMVAIAAPFKGSVYAWFFWLYPALNMFSPKSKIITKLLGKTSANKQIISIYGSFDPHIPEGSELVEAVNRQINAKGHFKILGSPVLHREVIAQLQHLAGNK